jgi:hypothetical protein
MKADELMLGNIIQYEYEGERFVARVKEIHKDSVLVEEVNGKYEEIEIPMRDIHPITLNPGFFCKNGFQGKYSLWDGMMYVMLYIPANFADTHDTVVEYDGENIFVDHRGVSKFCGHISYVHELQNAFKQCKIAREIVI